MVSLSKERMPQREIEVAHLISEEETIEQMTKVRSQTNVVVEMQKTTAPPVVKTDDLKTQLEEARKETNKVFTVLSWAVAVIFLLLFIFATVLSKLIDGHDVAFGVSRIVTCLLACAAVSTATLLTFDVHPFP